jgi:hypothetical protein
MSFTGLVLGGIDVPIIYSIDTNYVDNPYFDVDLTGWTSPDGGTTGRVLDDEAYGEYVATINGVKKTIEYEYNLGSTDPSGKTFIVSLRLKSDVARNVPIKLLIEDSAGTPNVETFVNTAVVATTSMNRFFLVGTVDGSTLTTADYTLKVQIQSTSNIVSGTTSFDHVYLTEVLDTYTLTQPKTSGSEISNIEFEKVLFGKNELWSGKQQEFNKRWRINFFAQWDYMNISEETLRKQIAEASRLFVKPHDDVNWGFHGLWDGNFFKKYSMNRFIGHKGIIPIKGTELLTKAGTELIDNISAEELLVLDTFTDTPSTDIESHTSDSGHSWKEDAGGARIDAAGAELDTFGVQWRGVVEDIVANAIVQCDFRCTAGASWDAGLMLRRKSNEDYIKASINMGITDDLTIDEIIESPFSSNNIATVSGPGLSNSTVYTLYAEVNGTSIYIAVKNSSGAILVSASATTSFNLTEDDYGMVFGVSSAFFADDFQIKQYS